MNKEDFYQLYRLRRKETFEVKESWREDYSYSVKVIIEGKDGAFRKATVIHTKSLTAPMAIETAALKLKTAKRDEIITLSAKQEKDWDKR